MISSRRNVRRVYDGLADSLAYVFVQMDAQKLGKRATGDEYVPHAWKRMTALEKGQARRALRQRLSASVLLEG